MSSRFCLKNVLFLCILLLCLTGVSCGTRNPAVTWHEGSYALKAVSSKKTAGNTVAWLFPADLARNAATDELLTLTADLTVSGIQSVTLALLYDENTPSAGAQITGIPVEEPVRLSIGMANDSRMRQLPAGFMIQYEPAAEKPELQVLAVRLDSFEAGWSRYPQVTFKFPSEGGKASYSETCPSTFDFSRITGDSFSGSGLHTITAGFEPSLLRDGSGTVTQKTVEFTVGTEKVQVRQSPAQRSVTLYPSQFRNKGSRISVVSEKNLVSSLFYSIRPQQDTLSAPIPADPGLILTWARSEWQNPDYQLYRWEQFPQVLVFDFADYDIQDDMLKRLAFFTEKAGFKGRLAPDSEIAEMHGYNAHDYRSESLAAFFNTAAVEQFPLNDRELQLRSILLQEQILIPSENPDIPYTAGYGAIISISQESANSLRWQLLTHECYHGIFFVDPAFRAHVATVYDTMDRRSLEFLLMYFRTQKSLGYDTDDRYLMHTELMSYLLQQGRTAAVDYFVRRADYKSMFTENLELCEYVKNTDAQGFVDAHQRLEAYVFTNYGLKGGRVNLVER